MTKRERSRAAMLEALEEKCLFCGEPLLGELDVLGEELAWFGCCQPGREFVEASGFWESLEHRDRISLLEASLAIRPRELVVTDDAWLLLAELELRPIPREEAKAFVRAHHRNHPRPPAGDVFRLGAFVGGELVGVAIVGRPVSRRLDDGTRLEVTRLATLDSWRSRNAASSLYAAAAREARRRGYAKIQTYVLESEAGTTLVAAGWVEEARTRGGRWSRKGRPREDLAPTCPKRRFAKDLRQA